MTIFGTLDNYNKGKKAEKRRFFMGFIFVIIVLPVILPLLILGYTILFNGDKWTGEKKDTQKYIEAYYDEYVHSENSPVYNSNKKEV